MGLFCVNGSCELDMNNMDLKYNYVFLGGDTDYTKIAYGDIHTVSWAKHLYHRIDSRNVFLNKLYQLHTSPKTNRFFKIPGQGIWNKMMFRGSFEDDKPICFAFNPWSRWLRKETLSYLRKNYPGCRIAVIFQDLIAMTFGLYPEFMYPEGLEALLEQVDIALTFDHADAKKYGMHYYPLVYSHCDIPDDPGVPESDVYFVGKAKDRLPQILAAYEKLRDAGLKCDFYITGVAPENQKYADQIHYCGQMPYMENLKHIKKTKCLLEIMQGGGHGYTLRVCEAIMYDKKMITDNPEIANAPFYRPELISVFDGVENIDPAFVKAEPAVADYGWKQALSPLRLLEYIDERI